MLRVHAQGHWLAIDIEAYLCVMGERYRDSNRRQECQSGCAPMPVLPKLLASVQYQ
jgi:hypothetical protein